MTFTWDIFVFVCVSLLQATGYYALRSLLYATPSPADVKRRSWLLSLAASGTFALLVYPAITLPALAAAFSGPAAFRAFFAVEGPLHRLATLYFLSFLCLDCGIGWLDYRDQLRLDTTWLHHIVIGAFLVVLLRSNACMVFLLAAPFEVPTFILSLGSVLPAYRNDFLFGSTFFFYRILYEVVLIVYLWVVTDVGALTLIVMGVPTLSFHSFWFYKWQRSYRAKAGLGEAEGSGGAAGGEGGSGSIGGSGSAGSAGSASGGGVGSGAGGAGSGGGVGGSSGAGLGSDLELGGSGSGAGAKATAPEPKLHAPPNTAKVQTLLSAGVVSVSAAAEKAAAAAAKPGELETKLVRSPPVRNKERQA